MSATVSQAPGSDGFWGAVKSGVGAGVGFIGRELLPIWAAKQLELQSTDQLSRSTFNRLNAPPRAQAVQDTGNPAPAAAGVVISQQMLLLAGGAIAAGLLLARL